MRQLASILLFGLLFVLASGLFGLGGSLSAQEVPSPAQVLGYDLGEEFTTVAGVNLYMNALAEASDRVSVHPYGHTYEGRPLIQVLVASAAHRARLDEILDMNRELTDPNTSEARAEEIIRTNPAVVYLSYGVHGNESSSSEAAMWTAWDLARGAEDVAQVLDSVIVILDPILNPDGRDRYVDFYRRTRSLEPNPNGSTLEHDEPWPGGRVNHYLFDLNRDWAWATQIETQERLATWDRWNPQVHADLHEMGVNSSYFFFPPAEPINPLFPEFILDWGRRIGEGNAAAFNREGWLYYAAEGFDLFYPAYGDTWPSLTGAIGMTYEQAGGGGAGLLIERSDGTMLSLRDRATHHWVASKATVRTAAQGRSDLLLGYAEIHRNIDADIQDVLLVPGEGPEHVNALVEHLLSQGIQVDRSTESFRAQATPHPGYQARQNFPSGTYRVPARQPRGRLAAALLQPDQLLEGEFSYDITAWSLPYAYGVAAYTLEADVNADFQPVTELPSPSTGPEVTGTPYGYLVTPGFDVMPALVEFLKRGGRAYAQPDTFRMNGTLYPLGTLFLARGRNPDLEETVRDTGLEPFLTPVSTGLTESGADLGTDGAGFVTLPKIAVVGGEGTSSGSYGAHWFFLERVLHMPFDAISVASLSNTDLDRYDVLVFPEGAGRLAEAQSQAVEEWVSGGGTLVAVGSSAQALGRSLGGMEMRTAEPADLSDDEKLAQALRTREERRTDRWEQSIPGSILKVELDPGHPLTAGVSADGLEDEMFVLTRGRSFEPSDDFESVAFFPRDEGEIAGVISESGLERMAQSTWLADVGIGRGRVILFVEDPLFRMFWYSGFQVYANALLLGPAF